MTPVLCVKGENRPPFHRYTPVGPSAATATECRPATRRLPEDTGSAPMALFMVIGAVLRLGILVLMVVPDSSEKCLPLADGERRRAADPPVGSWLVPRQAGDPARLDVGFRIQLARNLL